MASSSIWPMVAPCVHFTSSARICSLGVLSHDDPSVEHTSRSVVQDSLVQLVARAPGAGVIDERVVVHVLRAAGDVQAVQTHLPSLGTEERAEIGAHQLTPQRDVPGSEAGVASQVGLQDADVERLLAL